MKKVQLEKKYNFYINGRAINEDYFMELLTEAVSKDYMKKHNTKELEGSRLMMVAFEGALEGVKIFERILEKNETVEVYGLEFMAVECGGSAVQ